jgi:hypothetical protein
MDRFIQLFKYFSSWGSFTGPVGKPSAGFRMCRVEDIAHALERAYEFGLLVGHAATRAVCARDR